MPYVDAVTTLDIDFGKTLWQVLRQNTSFSAQGVFWLLEPENGWRLMVATPRVDNVGRRKAYDELGNITRGVVPGAAQPSRIELISPRDPFYQALRAVFGNRPSAEGSRLGNTQVGGMYIEDAYLYQVD